MKSGQTLSRNTRRKKQATDFWLNVATDFNGGMPPVDIAQRYINSKTGKHYSVKHIYWVLRQMNITNFN